MSQKGPTEMRVDSRVHVPDHASEIRRIESRILNHFLKEKTARNEIQALITFQIQSPIANSDSTQKKLGELTVKLDGLKVNRSEVQNLINGASGLTIFEKAYLKNVYELEILKGDRQSADNQFESQKTEGRIASLSEQKSIQMHLLSGSNRQTLNNRGIQAREDPLKISGILQKSASVLSEKSGRSGPFLGSQPFVPLKKNQYRLNGLAANRNYVLRRKLNVDLRTSPYVKKFEKITDPKKPNHQSVGLMKTKGIR